jgi:hypothetical protein
MANGEHPRAVLQRVESRLRTLQMLADGLLASYDETLAIESSLAQDSGN